MTEHVTSVVSIGYGVNSKKCTPTKRAKKCTPTKRAKVLSPPFGRNLAIGFKNKQKKRLIKCMMVIIRYLCGVKKGYINRCRLVGIHVKRNDDSSQSYTDAHKTCRRWARPSKMAGKTGIEFHWPGYQYLGAGTRLQKRLKRGDPGINRLNKISKQHDIDYCCAKNSQAKWKADAKMIKAIDKLPGSKTLTKKIVKRILQAKKRLKL